MGLSLLCVHFITCEKKTSEILKIPEVFSFYLITGSMAAAL